MPSETHLTNAPIVEGLIDLRVKPNNDFTPETLVGLRDLLKVQYPVQKEAVQIQANFEVKADSSRSPTLRETTDC